MCKWLLSVKACFLFSIVWFIWVPACFAGEVPSSRTTQPGADLQTSDILPSGSAAGDMETGDMETKDVSDSKSTVGLPLNIKSFDLAQWKAKGAVIVGALEQQGRNFRPLFTIHQSLIEAVDAKLPPEVLVEPLWQVYFENSSLTSFKLEGRRLVADTDGFFKGSFALADSISATALEQIRRISNTDLGSLTEGKKFYRPFLVSNRALVKDPDGWVKMAGKMPEKIPLTARKKLIHAYLAMFPKGSCFYRKHPQKDTLSEREFKFSENEIDWRWSQIARTNDRVVAVNLKMPSQGCETMDKVVGAQVTFFIPAKGPAFSLLSKERDRQNIVFIDAADLDGDGYSELLFFNFEKQIDGYLIVNGKTKKITEWNRDTLKLNREIAH